MKNATVLGSTGFIGRHLTQYLNQLGVSCWLPQRDDPDIFRRPLGTLFYCIGLTADFRSRPLATFDAHSLILRQLLEYADFEKLIYLSSTRVYTGNPIADENQDLRVNSQRPDDLYNLSKLMGESLLLSSGRPGCVVRLSNVLGPDMGSVNFVGAVVAEAQRTHQVLFHTSLESAKDYIWIDDVVKGLVGISSVSTPALYNLAAGFNISHQQLADILVSHGVGITVVEGAPVHVFPRIEVNRIYQDTGFVAQPVMPKFADLVATALH